MTEPPQNPLIYHITHVDNLATIAQSGGLMSDARLAAAGGSTASVGMSKIKKRRLQLPVRCHPGDCVGDYVPFYFCPRSIMLYVIHCGNHPDLAYRGGQAPIVHLVANMREVVAWAESVSRRWAFSLSNAGARHAQFRADLGGLREVDWRAVNARDFRSAAIREGKQAEFLVHDDFPWRLVQRIGVYSKAIRDRAVSAVAGVSHQPVVNVMPGWYC